MQSSKPMGRAREKDAPNRIPPLWLAFFLTALLASFSLLPRVRADLRMAASFWGASCVLVLLLFFLRRDVARAGRALRYEFVPVKSHYVQLLMHCCIYAYWGWYWPQVYSFAPLIAAQLVFAYALDMLVCWLRRDKWILGFGPFPVVLSTNLFLWFKDDWFFLQFLLVATGVLGKEFIKWKREGHVTHIFNPSAFAPFVFVVGLILTKSTTQISWGEEIATTIARPPYMYVAIFLVGLVVQALFSVTLVTLSSVVALCVLNLAYTHTTGVYQFLDANIPVSVFLGLHLLVTDPSTSPRTTLGKILFGGMYGAGVFGMYGFMGWVGGPQFYDKLLCVPALNLSVRALDRASRTLADRFPALHSAWTWSPRQANFAHMAIWIVLFATMMGTGFLGRHHPGADPEFWRRACLEGRPNSCKTWVRSLNVSCRNDSAAACFALGQALDEGRAVPRDQREAIKSFGRACDLGLSDGCASLVEFVRTNGEDVFLRACDRGDGATCFILGSLLHGGKGIPRDDGRAVSLFQRSCVNGWWRGCSRLGESYLFGEGTAADPAKAIDSFEKACRGKYAAGCFNAAMMYRLGTVGPKNEALARQRLRQACELGVPSACQKAESPAPSS